MAAFEILSSRTRVGRNLGRIERARLEGLQNVARSFYLSPQVRFTTKDLFGNRRELNLCSKVLQSLFSSSKTICFCCFSYMLQVKMPVVNKQMYVGRVRFAGRARRDTSCSIFLATVGEYVLR